MPPFNLDFFLLGVFGGALPDIIRIIKGRYEKKFPEYLKYPGFWAGFVLLIALGGLAAWLLGADNVKTALALGFSAPEIFSRLASRSDGPDQDREAPFKLRDWWSR